MGTTVDGAWRAAVVAECVRLGGSETGAWALLKAEREGTAPRSVRLAVGRHPSVAAQILVVHEGQALLAQGKALAERGWRLMQASAAVATADDGPRPTSRAALWVGVVTALTFAAVLGAAVFGGP